jgi:hypothetical protein
MDASCIHPFARRALELLANGVSTAVLEAALQRELDAYARNHMAAARVWQQAGGYAPTFGILGSVLGLIQVPCSAVLSLRLRDAMHCIAWIGSHSLYARLRHRRGAL